jgi:putative tricarboxylic transport membrane protein
VIRTQLLSPFVFALATLGAFVYRGRIEDVIVTFLFGFIGYYMKKHGWPRVTFVIAVVLGSLLETNFHITLKLHQLGRINFWTRPIAMALLGLALISLILPALQMWRTWKAEGRQ